MWNCIERVRSRRSSWLLFFCGVAFVCLEGQKPNGYLKHIDSAMVRLRNSDLRVRDVKG